MSLTGWVGGIAALEGASICAEATTLPAYPLRMRKPPDQCHHQYPRGVNPGDAITKDSYRQASLLMNQGVLAELADGTGGTLFRNNNNLEAGLASLLAGPQYLYLLAFSTADQQKVSVNASGRPVPANIPHYPNKIPIKYLLNYGK
jgi:hypothetical protein